MRYPDQPIMLFADGDAASGGAPAPTSAPSSPPDGGTGGPAPTQLTRIPDSPDEPPERHDQLAGFEDNDFDLVEIPREEAPQAGEADLAPPPAAPAAQPQQPAAKPPAQPQQPETAKQPAAYAPQAPRMPLDQAIEGFRTSHNELSNWASQQLFKLSPEEQTALETDAVSVIPVLMGKVYSQAIQATVNLMKNFVPEMINSGVNSTNARNAKATEALQEFYAANQHLNPQQHGALVDKWARAFRAANPQASRADAIKFVGNAVSSELGIAAPVGSNGAAPRRAPPFAPARPGTRVQQPAPPHDPYEGMDMEYDQN